MPKLNENTDLTVPLKNLIALIIATVVLATTYFEIQGRLAHLEFQQEVIWGKVRASEDYRNTFNPLDAVEGHIDKQHQMEMLISNIELRLKYLEGE